MTSCWLPYYHAEVLTDGSVKPCCKFQGNWIDSLNNYTSVNRTEFTTPILPNACSACKVPSDVFSYRKHRTIEFVRNGWSEPITPELRNLNISIDNVCASSCLQCSPKQSTTIGQLLGNQIKLSWDLDSLDQHLSTIESLTISGGEPLQSPRLIALCEKIKLSNIKFISIPTGLTKVKMQNVEALASLGIPVQMRVSIDGPWGLNEWIRGCEQEDWETSFNLVSKQFTTAWQLTLGSYNVFALPECLDYIETLATNKHIQPSPIIWPETHAIRQLPNNVKEQVKNKLSAYTAKNNAREIIATAMTLLEHEQTFDWASCVDAIERIPKLRGSTQSLDYFIKRYL